MKLENVFIGFRNHSFEKIAELFADKKISEKEKYLYIAVCENSVNSITGIINEFNAKKDLVESDFNWLMKAYTSFCIRELYDIFDNIEREGAKPDVIGGIIKNAIDIDFTVAMEHFQIIIGGEDIKKFFDSMLDFIKSSDKDAKGFDQFVLGRNAPMLMFFKENSVEFDLIPPEKLLEISKNNYDNGMKNFIKICCRSQEK